MHGGFAGAAGIDGIVVHALRYQDLATSVFRIQRRGVDWVPYQVCDAEVHGQRDDGGHETGPQGAGEVGDIADEPDGQEDQGDPVCGARLIVLDQLGDLGVLAISWL